MENELPVLPGGRWVHGNNFCTNFGELEVTFAIHHEVQKREKNAKNARFFFRMRLSFVDLCRKKRYTIDENIFFLRWQMKVSYKKLWVMLANREMSKAELRKVAGISPATFTKLRRNQEVSLSVLLKIADALDCDAGDMISFVKEDAFIDAEANHVDLPKTV